MHTQHLITKPYIIGVFGLSLSLITPIIFSSTYFFINNLTHLSFGKNETVLRDS